MSVSSAPAQLACQIVNSAGGTAAENVIFVTPDRGYNEISLTIGLTSGSTTLSPGTIPYPASPPDDGSGTTLYVDLSQLRLPGDVWEQMAFQAEGWTFAKFADLATVGMTPAGAAVPLGSEPADTITFRINGITLPSAPAERRVNVDIDYCNVPGIGGGYYTLLTELLQAPGEQADLSEAIAVSVSSNAIVNSVESLPLARNSFALQFASKGPVVRAGPDTRFFVRFVYGKGGNTYGRGALTSVTRAKAILAGRGTNTGGWGIYWDTKAAAPDLTLTPPEKASIVGTGTRSVAEINFSNVVTTYQPGPTTMQVSCRNVPGYKDGEFTVVLNKVPHVVIGSLEVTPNPAQLIHGSASVTVTWEVAHAQRLELVQEDHLVLVTGKTEQAATLGVSTIFGLRASGTTGTVDNVDYKTIHAKVYPPVRTIECFTAEPGIADDGTTGKIILTWTLDPDDQDASTDVVNLTNGEDLTPGRHPPGNGTTRDWVRPVKARYPAALELTATWPRGEKATATRHLLGQNGFRDLPGTSQVQTAPLAFGGDYLWTPNAKIDPSTCEVVSTFDTFELDCLGMTFSNTSPWIAGNAGDGRGSVLLEVDPVTGRLGYTIFTSDFGLESVRGIAFDGTYLWVIDQTGSNYLWRFDPDSTAPLHKVKLPTYPAPQAIAYDGRYLWIASSSVVEHISRANLLRVDPEGLGYTAIRLGISFSSITYDRARNRLWGIGTADAQGTPRFPWQLAEIDSGAVVQTMPLPLQGDSGGRPPGIVWDGRDSLWVGGNGLLGRISLPRQRTAS